MFAFGWKFAFGLKFAFLTSGSNDLPRCFQSYKEKKLRAAAVSSCTATFVSLTAMATSVCD